MTDVLTFIVEEDGQVRHVEVPLSTDDLPEEIVARIALISADRRTAALLAYRLSVPLEAAERLVDELLAGEGVVVA